MEWEQAEKVQKNANGEYRAMIGGEWVPVEKAQKNAAGEYRIQRSSKVDAPISEDSIQQEQPNKLNSDMSFDTVFRKPTAEQNAQRVEDITNLGAGAVRGAGSIGRTLLTGSKLLTRPSDYKSILNEDTERRGAIDEGLTNLIGSNPNAGLYKTGKIGTEIAGTLAIPIPFAKGASGVTERLVQAAKNIPIGAIAGGGFGFVSEGQEGVKPGAVAGGLMAGGLEAAKAIGSGAGNIIGPHLPKIDLAKHLPYGDKIRPYLPQALQGETSGAERVAIEVMTDPKITNQDKIAKLLLKAKKGETAAEATLPLANAEVAGLEKIVSANKPSIANANLAKKKAIEEAMLKRIAGGDNQTSALQASKMNRGVLNQVTSPMRETELAAANTAKIKSALEEKANKLSGVAANKVQDVRRFNAAEQRARDIANNTTPQAGMPRVSGKYSYMGEKGGIADRAAQVSDKSASSSLPLGEGARFAQMQAESLAAHGLKPLNTDTITSSLSRKIVSPELAGNKKSASVLTRVIDDINDWKKANGGIIDANALYSIRKNSVAEAVDDLTKGLDPKASARFTAKMLGEITPKIDDAIEAAGGTKWRDYLKVHSAGEHAIAQESMGAKALDIYQKTPDKLIDLANGNAPKVVEKIFGKGKIDLAEQMDGKENTIKYIAEEINKRNEVKRLGTLGAGKAGSILRDDDALAKLPAFVDMKIAITNKILSALQGKGSSKATDALSDLMLTDPKRLGELMIKATKTDKQILLNAISQRASVLSAPALITNKER